MQFSSISYHDKCSNVETLWQTLCAGSGFIIHDRNASPSSEPWTDHTDWESNDQYIKHGTTESSDLDQAPLSDNKLNWFQKKETQFAQRVMSTVPNITCSFCFCTHNFVRIRREF